MGRATEGFHFINQTQRERDQEGLYTNLTITEDLIKLRKEHLLSKKDRLVAEKSGLKPAGDGTFSLF